MAFDPVNEKVLLFGGSGVGSVLGLAMKSRDCWAWDGIRWVELPPVARGPSARSRHAMVTDPRRRKIVLQGGIEDVEDVVDTWEWDGARWSQVSSDGGVVPRWSNPGAAFDTVRSHVVTIQSTSGGARSWDGSRWADHSVTGLPPGVYAPDLAFDESSGRLLLFVDGSYALAPNTLWAFDRGRWSQIGRLESPRLVEVEMVYDQARHRLIVVGLGERAGRPTFETWFFEQGRWTELPRSEMPSPREETTMAYDPRRGTTVLFGGLAGEKLMSDTWELEEERWILAHRGRPDGT